MSDEVNIDRHLRVDRVSGRRSGYSILMIAPVPYPFTYTSDDYAQRQSIFELDININANKELKR